MFPPPQRSLGIPVTTTILVFIFSFIILCLFLLYTTTGIHVDYELAPKEQIRKLKTDDPTK